MIVEEILTSVDTDTASAVSSCEVTALAHEVLNHSVEFRRLVANSSLACA